MARLITIEGPGGSGKTTLGYELARVLPKSVCYDLDDYIDPVTSALGLDNPQTYQKIGESLGDFYRTIEKDLDEGRDVILPYWSYSADLVEPFAKKLDELSSNGHKVSHFMIESPLERCIRGDSQREKNLGSAHISDIWGRTYKGIHGNHILVPNGDYGALERIEGHLNYL